MQRAVFLVVDTNLFHECRSLDAPDFPWSDLGDFDTVELIVSDPVQSELDRHKKDTRPRVKRRAVQAVAWFREMLRTGTREHVFRQQDPRVVMRVTAQTASSDFPEFLDPTVDDDKIVGVAVALAKAAPEQDVRVLSHDTRPMAKADAVGLRFEFIPDSWIREPEADDQEREIARLRAEVAELQASHPALAVAAISAVDRRLSLTREALATLSEAEIASFRTQLSEQFSLAGVEETFADAPSSRRPSSFPLRRNMVHVPPSEHVINRYRDETYPAWLDACASHVASLPSAFNSLIAPSAVTVTLDNTGYRPAENVRIRFTARGPFLIAPPREEGYNPELADLPQVPRPPTGQWLQDGNPVAFATSIEDAFDPRLLDIGHLRPAAFARDDEAWYYEPERPDTPVVSFDLGCRRFRHGTGPEHFELLIFPQSQEAVVRGALEVEVNASNVGRSLTVTFPVEVNTTLKPPVPAINSFLADQDPIGPTRDVGRKFF